MSIYCCLVGMLLLYARSIHADSSGLGLEFSSDLSAEDDLFLSTMHNLNSTTELNTKSSNYEGVWHPPIDHRDHSVGRFKQRWFRNNVHAASNVAILYIAGREAVTRSMGGAPLSLAKNLSAALITVEHRYYGGSLPFPLAAREKLRYLTVEQALADFAAFARWYSRRVAGARLRWVAVGGGYAGGLSAWLRGDYPALFSAAWSSSGTVNAVLDHFGYDQHAKDVLPTQCAEAVRGALAGVAAAWDRGAPGQAQVRGVFKIPAHFSKLDVLWALSDRARRGGAARPQGGPLRRAEAARGRRGRWSGCARASRGRWAWTSRSCAATAPAARPTPPTRTCGGAAWPGSTRSARSWGSGSTGTPAPCAPLS